MPLLLIDDQQSAVQAAIIFTWFFKQPDKDE